MRRQIIILSALVIVDLLLPDVDTGAQLAIAPAVLAAIISAMGSMAASANKKPGELQPPSGGGINMQPANAKTGMLPPKSMEEAAFQLEQGGPAGSIQSMAPAITGKSMVPESKMQPEIEKADAGKNAGNYPLTPPQAEKFGTGELLTPGFGETPLQDPAVKEGMSFDEKMQMAALVAQLGSALSGPGAPPPPGAPRGGGIGMSPVFQNMTARGMYG
jgi:hypothetical protein